MTTDTEFVRTDPDQPPVAIRQRSALTPTARVAYLCIGLLGGFGWTMIAIIRGEEVNSVWFVVAAVCTYIIAFRFYARLIEYKIVKPKDERATPAETHGNGKDFDATDRRVLFGHHFAAIAGAGPLVGPVLAAQMGYLPGTMWIIIGVVVRRRGAGLPGALALHPPPRPQPRPDGPRRTGPGRRSRRPDRRFRHHDHSHRGAGPGGGQRAGREPVGRVLPAA